MKLYKYVHPDRADLFDNLLVRFTQPNSFNDPFELKPYYDAIASDEEMRRVVSETSMEDVLKQELLDARSKIPLEVQQVMTPEVVDSFAKEVAPYALELMPDILQTITGILRQPLTDGFNKNIGILSLTEKPDNLLMWAHYAAHHTGFVLEFDADDSYFHQRRSEADEFGYLRKVTYSSARPNVVMTNVSSTDVFLTKSKEWEYEQEWRMLRPLQFASVTIPNDGDPIHLFKIVPACITGVIFGCRMMDKNRNELRLKLSSKPELSHVTLSESILDERRFQLNINSVS